MFIGRVGAQSSAASNTPGESTLGLVLLGGGARWAAGNGTSALFINTADNYYAHHLTDGATWGPWPTEQYMEHTRDAISGALNQSGLNVSFAGNFPSDLSSYSVVVVESYWACTPQIAPLIENYVSNGGGLVLLAGVPAYIASFSKTLNVNTDLSPIEAWFGAGQYLNTNGLARVVASNPFNTDLQTGEPIYNVNGSSAASVVSLDDNASVVALWDSGSVFAFTNEYGQGRVYYQADTDTWDSFFEPSSPATSSQEATLAVTCASSTLNSGFTVNINGNLSFDNTAIAQAPIMLSYSLDGGETWQNLTFTYTDADGSFAAVWLPSVTGTFFIEATWEGNTIFYPVNTTVSIVVTPISILNAQNIISIVSNSTVSSFAFNSTTQELSFTVTGPSGTTGYIDAYLAKTLINDPSHLQVFLDGNQLNYNVTQTQDSWLIHFTYHHSTHSIVINLGQTTSNPSQGIPLRIEIIVGVLIAVFLTALAVGIGLAFRKEDTTKSIRT